jgi:hypothetical protein
MPVAARIICDANKAALHALLDMTAEGGRAASLDRAHDAAFGAAEVSGMRLAISRAVAAEDVRHLLFGALTGLGDAPFFARCVADLRRIKWVVYAKRPLPAPKRSWPISAATRTASPPRIAG